MGGLQAQRIAPSSATLAAGARVCSQVSGVEWPEWLAARTKKTSECSGREVAARWRLAVVVTRLLAAGRGTLEPWVTFNLAELDCTHPGLPSVATFVAGAYFMGGAPHDVLRA